jgi:hypothetical protein
MGDQGRPKFAFAREKRYYHRSHCPFSEGGSAHGSFRRPENTRHAAVSSQGEGTGCDHGHFETMREPTEWSVAIPAHREK